MDNAINVILEKTVSEEIKIKEFHSLIKEYKKHANTPEKGLLYSEIGVLQFKNNHKEEAINSIITSIAILKKYKKDANYLEALNRSRSNLAWIYMLDKKSKQQYELLLAIIKDNAKDTYTFNAQINAALIESQNGDYYQALKRLHLLLSQKNDIEEQLIVRCNIVKVYAFMAEIDTNHSMQSYKSIVEKHQKIIDKNFNTTTLDSKLLYEFYNNSANIYESCNDYDMALGLYLKSKLYFKNQNNFQDYFYVLNNIGYLYAKKIESI